MLHRFKKYQIRLPTKESDDSDGDENAQNINTSVNADLYSNA